MKRIYTAITIVLYAHCIFTMEAPSQPLLLTIVGQRTGTINTSCTTTADLMRDGASLAHIAYSLEGASRIRPLICAMGPIAYQNNLFLGRITHLALTAKESASFSLLAFAIQNLKELHTQQYTTGIKNPNLFIDALVNPGSYEQYAYEAFGFKKVGNWYASGNEQHVYLLDSTPEAPETANLRYQHYLLPFLKIDITTTEEKSDHEYLPKALTEDEYNKLNDKIRAQQDEVTPPLLTPLAAAATHLQESKHLALATLQASPGTPQKLSRAQTEALQYRSGLTPITGIPHSASPAPTSTTYPRAIRSISEIAPKIRKSPRLTHKKP